MRGLKQVSPNYVALTGMLMLCNGILDMLASIQTINLMSPELGLSLDYLLFARKDYIEYLREWVKSLTDEDDDLMFTAFDTEIGCMFSAYLI